MDDDCRVHWATGTRGEEILGRLAKISQDLKGDYVAAFRQQRAERNTGHVFKVIFFHVRHGNWWFLAEFFRKIRFEHIAMGVRWLSGIIGQYTKGKLS